MGQIYSFLGYASTSGNNHNQQELLRYNFTCKICHEILHDPVQCQNNEDYFCRKCIAKHLENSQTCPLCFNRLTIETIRPPSRIIANVVSNLNTPRRCNYASRGCDANITVKELLMHEQTCAYAPVPCPNEGCEETVSRRDKEVHKTEECKFRKIICESCAEEIVYIDYFKKHQCNLTLRREMDRINETLKQLVATVTEHTLMLAARDTSKALLNQKIYILGGELFNGKINKSVEVFDWSTKKWTLIENCLFFNRYQSFSFIYENKIMVCGGTAERIEYLNPSKSVCTSTISSISLPKNANHNGVLYENKIITFNKGVVETSLESPSTSKTLKNEKQCRDYAGVHRFGYDIYIVGGQPSMMEKYDVAKNEIETLPSVPYRVSNMATVMYKDNIVLLGGSRNARWSECEPLNDVVMFNVTNWKYTRLPGMLEKRSGCAAVIMGDLIVVMGGETGSEKSLKTVEFLVIGNSAWRKLPAMNMERYAATACVYMN